MPLLEDSIINSGLDTAPTQLITLRTSCLCNESGLMTRVANPQ
jgi:hypothetical protein